MAENESPILEGAFALGTFDGAGGAFPGVVVDDRVFDLRPLFGAGTTVLGLLQDWEASIDRIEQRLGSLRDGVPVGELRPLPPIDPVGQLLCAGANYARHVQQIVFSYYRNQGDQRSDEELQAVALEQARDRVGEPFMFSGLASAVSGAQDDIVLWSPGEQHDWELELGVVIGRPAAGVDRADALDYVAGYTISNDITVRDVMARPGLPLTDYLTSKNRPTYFPTGPYIVPRRFIPDYRRLRITLAVNGEVMQDQEIDDIIHDVEACVSYASHMARLSPGDVILTGSPAGNAGHHGNRWLVPGDVIDATITGLGAQRTTCVAPPT